GTILIANKSDALAIRRPSWAGGHGTLEKRELDGFTTGDGTFEDVCFVGVGPQCKRYPAPIGRETRCAIIRGARCQSADFRLCLFLCIWEIDSPQVRIMILPRVCQPSPISG